MQSTFRSASILYGFAATAALFTCFAIVLNPIPFTNAPTPDLKRFHQEASQSSGGPQINVEREPQFEPIAQLPEKVAEISAPVRNLQEAPATPAPVRNLEETPTTPAPVRNLQETPTTPDFDDNRTAPAQATIVGVWAPDASPCTVRNFRDGFLPTIINTDGAWAGDTFCIFRNQKKTETGWGVIANCSNGRERWTAPVRLSVKGDRLTWTSKRGVQIYTRCTRDFLMAEAP